MKNVIRNIKEAFNVIKWIVVFFFATICFLNFLMCFMGYLTSPVGGEPIFCTRSHFAETNGDALADKLMMPTILFMCDR